LSALQKLGFEFRIKGHLAPDSQARYPVDGRVSRFFPAIGLPLALPSWSEAQNYFYSVYQNSIQQLLAFTVMVTGGVLGYHGWQLLRLRQARNKIPLVVGGWGTRGKSGSERLKAALFNAMGWSVLSKTSGCEAMFLYGPAGRPMKEMFLFRPYDKATIWEQVFLTRLSQKLGADVFLWECMGLTPRYIDILQNQWMRDDIATITNCYLDHEDLQGPAGIDIPIVMQRFVPKSSTLITTEDTMLPLLEDAARQKDTQLVSVNWLDAGLLTEDVLARFPYEEHPNNIALVTRLAESVGVPADVALQAMADYVVPDLGVLKIYPTATVRQRRFQFINGMSANERLATLENWRRTGMDKHGLENDPATWLSVVVNNRADRVARSKVFAAILVNDMHADRYYFIGDNLAGLQSYIDEAWQQTVAKQQFVAEDGEGVSLLREASRFRIPVNTEQVLGRLRACIEGLSLDDDTKTQQLAALPQQLDEQQLSNWSASLIEDDSLRQSIEQQFRQDAQECRAYLDYSQQLQANPNDANLQQQIERWLFDCFKARWVVVDDYFSTGNQTIDTIVEHTPAGLFCRLIGVQNIKGTGLDFIYRWQAWDKVFNDCETLINSDDPDSIQDAARALATWEEFGVVDEETVRDSLNKAAGRKALQRELLQAELKLIEQRLKRQLKLIKESFGASTGDNSKLNRLFEIMEAFLDSSDAVRRRKTADNIYRALLDNLISYDRATVELANLTKAQKGGWLLKKARKLIPGL
jgi:poly-gamma-glutamate synthase PgsB/CapB